MSRNYHKNKKHYSEYNKKYYSENREKVKEYQKQYNKTHTKPIKVLENQRTYYHRNRQLFLTMYGGQCSCCGETSHEFLTIEHILGQKGVKRQSSSKAYREAIKFYNPELYEILCMNCNHAKGKYGYCPHNKS